METNLKILQSYDIPVLSMHSAVTFLNERPSLSTTEYIKRITELTGSHIEFKIAYQYRYHYLYLVQELIRANLNAFDVTLEQIHEEALRRSGVFVTNNPWLNLLTENGHVIASDPDAPQTTRARYGGRKGGKKAKAIALWNEKGGLAFGVRKDWIELLMKEADMSKPGASTYFANLKSGAYA